jgi:5'-nucleotidase
MTFGNHEFDLRKADFEKRIQELKFTWVSSNVFGEGGKPFPITPANVVITLTPGLESKPTDAS